MLSDTVTRDCLLYDGIKFLVAASYIKAAQTISDANRSSGVEAHKRLFAWPSAPGSCGTVTEEHRGLRHPNASNHPWAAVALDLTATLGLLHLPLLGSLQE